MSRSSEGDSLTSRGIGSPDQEGLTTKGRGGRYIYGWDEGFPQTAAWSGAAQGAPAWTAVSNAESAWASATATDRTWSEPT